MPHSNWGWVGVGSELGRGWIGVGLRFCRGLVGVWLRLGWSWIRIGFKKNQTLGIGVGGWYGP